MLYLLYRPWFRLPSYLMGLFAGLIVSRIHNSRYKIKIAFCKQILLHVIGFLICLTAVLLLAFNLAKIP